MINEKDITDDVMKQWKEINEEKEGLNEQAYKGSILEERLRLTRQIFALEKENAELKEHHKNVCKNLTDTHRNIREQLTKAKEIIKTFLGFAEAFGYSPSMDKFIAEAEQFLKE